MGLAGVMTHRRAAAAEQASLGWIHPFGVNFQLSPGGMLANR
jgi:hypothetical protein